MEQISRPFLIALVAVVGFAGVWMVVLRPKSADTTSPPLPASAPTAAVKKTPSTSSGPTAPGVKGLGRAIQHAKDVSAGKPVPNPVPSATATPAAPATATPAAPAVSAAAATPAPAAAPAKASAPVPAVAKAKPAAPALKHDGRATLLLFAGRGADDAVARDVVRSLRGPHVRTIIAPLSHLDLYSALIGNVQITSSPTILVIGSDSSARAIEGLPDVAQVKQALAAARKHH